MYKPKLTFKPVMRAEIKRNENMESRFKEALMHHAWSEVEDMMRGKDWNTIRPVKEVISPQSPEGFEVFNEDWLINEVGDLHYRHHYYPIDARDLKEELIKHLMQKKWFDANTFMPAYFEGQFRWEFHNEQKEEQQ